MQNLNLGFYAPKTLGILLKKVNEYCFFQQNTSKLQLQKHFLLKNFSINKMLFF